MLALMLLNLNKKSRGLIYKFIQTNFKRQVNRKQIVILVLLGLLSRFNDIN